MSTRSFEFDAILNRISAIGIAAKPNMKIEAAEDALGFFTDCLHTCMMPRHILVYLDEVYCLTVLGSGGRMLEIVECGGVPSLKSGPVDTAQAHVVSAALLEQFGAASSISVEFHPVQEAEQVAVHGVTGQQLLQATGVQFLREVDADPVDVLLDGAANVLLATYSPSDGARTMADGFVWVDGLQAWVDVVCKSLGAAGHGQVPGRLLVYRPAQFAELVVCFCMQDQHILALIVQKDAAAGIAEYWVGLPNMLVEP